MKNCTKRSGTEKKTILISLALSPSTHFLTTIYFSFISSTTFPTEAPPYVCCLLSSENKEFKGINKSRTEGNVFLPNCLLDW